MPNLKINLKDYKVFFDFDNTITQFDVLDNLIKRFAINDSWKQIEKKWTSGKIGSRKCLTDQLLITRISKNNLLKYLSKIKLDRHFKPLLRTLCAAGAKPVILSDSFSFIIKAILKNHNVNGVRIFANRLKFDKDRLIPEFPYTNRLCLRCANCKKSHILRQSAGKKIIYIGDGLSDVCASKNSHLVFAKGSLFKNLEGSKIKIIEFSGLGRVLDILRKKKDEKTKNR